MRQYSFSGGMSSTNVVMLFAMFFIKLNCYADWRI